MKKLIFICILIVNLFGKNQNFEQSDISDIHSLIIVYESYILKIDDEKNRKNMFEYLNLINFNDKNQVILAISRLENEVQKKIEKK